MTSSVVEMNDSVNVKNSKRKSDEVVDKVKKKKKNEHVEIVEMQQETVEAIDKVKKKKKKKHTEIVEEKQETDEVIEKVNKKRKSKHIETVAEKQETEEAIVKDNTKKNKNQQTQPVETKEDTDEVKEKNYNNNVANSYEINNKPKSTKVKELPTVSIAVPGSILDNAQSPELRTYLAGQIARAACIYKIDEVFFFNVLFMKNIFIFVFY